MFKSNILFVVQNWKTAAARIFGHVPPNFNPHAVRTGRKILKQIRVGPTFAKYYLNTTGTTNSFWERRNQNLYPRSAVWREVTPKHLQIERAAQNRRDRRVTATRKGEGKGKAKAKLAKPAATPKK